MADNDSWTCPYCNQVDPIISENVSQDHHQFDNGNKVGLLVLRTHVIVCPNSKCKEFTISARLFQARRTTGGVLSIGEPILSQDLKPQSSAKPFPNYIPAPVLRDYQEACLIRTLSPNASATLSRRCLQGIIRDFWGIKAARLVDEIAKLKEKIDPTTWKAIDAVRSIGNIGAHMEKDIDLIVEVDPQEADLLVGLIEVLLQEWYVHRHEREEHMQKVISTAQAKSAAKAKQIPDVSH